MKAPALVFPVRINKYLAHAGYSTRTGADALIQDGKVFVNGRRAVLGDRIQAHDVVEVRTGKKTTHYKYYAYHKARGIITHSAQGDEKEISTAVASIPELKGCFPIGRLDKDSSGLIILTNDGRITDRMLNPDHEHEKEYVVRTTQKLRASFKEHMEAGVVIEGYATKPCTVRILGEKVFRITLIEGKKHQIRRMVAAMHNEVVDLKRTRVLNISLDSLPEGGWRKIEDKELVAFLTTLGL